VAITNLPTPGGQESRSDDINARGQIAGQIISGFGLNVIRGVVWEKGRPEDLGVPPGYAFGPEAMNSSGTVVGSVSIEGSIPYGANFAFLWRHGVGHLLGMLPGDSSSFAHAINAAGDVVGVSSTGRLFGEHAVLWHKEKIVSLGTLPGDLASEAVGIDAAGRVFGYSLRTVFREDWRPFMWDRGVMTELSGLPKPGVGLWITRRGDVVAWTCPDSANKSKAATRRVGVVTWIACPVEEPGDQVVINDINSSGMAVGTRIYWDDPDGFPIFRPYVWSAGQSTPLPLLPGDPYGEANAINERGQVVGLSFSGPTLRGVLWTLR
jgi:probable HAF family extracellular repeat protein